MFFTSEQMIDNLGILKSNKFYEEIDKLVSDQGIPYLDAVVFYCEKYNIEIETAAAFIKSNSRMKSALQVEGEDLNFLPRTSRLPI